MVESEAAVERPPCPRCGVTTFPTRRTMRVHNLEGAKAIPLQKTVEVWRCPSCAKEMPRT
jgi:predicted RNA-binding Zn-ribbon protein involved in translation (DUF1610 family)